MPRRLLHIPRYALRILAAVLLGGVLLYFGLTRTQVGRDGLRDQIERSFAGTFEGRLEIGRLKGNLINDLFASDVRFYTPNGQLVAQIDSVVARPSWRSLFRRRVSIGSLTLLRPHIDLVYQADSTWNLSSIFAPRTAQHQPADQPWAFDSAELRIVDGSVQTHREAAPPPLVARNWLFDYTQSRATGVHARTTIEWTTATKLIDVLHLEASLPDVPLTLAEVQGQLVVEPEYLLLNQMIVRTLASDLQLNGALAGLAALRQGIPDSLAFDLDIAADPIDNDELRRIVPRLPLGDVMTASARVHGPLAHLTVEALHFERGDTQIMAEGAVLGLPDSLAIAVTLHESRLASDDLHALLPGTPLPDLNHWGILTLDAEGEGLVADFHQGQATTRWRFISELDVRGGPGHVAGTLAARQRSGRAPAYSFTLHTDSLNVGHLVQNPPLASTLNGRLAGQGRGLSLDSLTATLQADLFDARLAGRHADTLHAEVDIADRRLTTSVFAREREGSLALTGELAMTTSVPAYTLDLATQQFDLGPILAADLLETALNSRLTLEGAGFSMDDLHGALTVAFDSSEVRWINTTHLVSPHQTTLTLHAPSSDAPRVQLDGDVLTATLDGPLQAAPVQALTRLWVDVLTDALYRQLDKPLHRAPVLQTASAEAATYAPPAGLRETARQALADAGINALPLNLSVRLHRADILSALVPMIPLPEMRGDLTARLVAGDERLGVQGTLHGDELRTQGFRADTLRTTFEATLTLDAPPEYTLVATIEAHAAAMMLAGQPVGAPSLSAHMQHGEAQLSLTTAPHDSTGATRLAAAFALLPDRNRLTLIDVHLPLGGVVWTNPENAEIDLYADATVVPDLLLQSQSLAEAWAQRVRLHGTLSAAPQDTLFAEMAAIGLRQLSDFLALRYDLGGHVAGQVALTGGTQPELTGHLVVNNLAFDDQLLGRLEATSRYVPGQPDVVLDLLLQPDDATPPPPNLRPTDNRLRLAGTFRLPGVGTRQNPGALDLRLDAERADAFFFEYLFSDLVANVQGAISGEGAIRGTFQRPLFNADMRVVGGRFDVPAFNLHYAVEGPVAVDDEGFKLRDVTLSDDTGGRASVSGGILFNDYRFFSFDLAATLDDLTIIDVTSSRDLAFYGRIWASGNATLTGPLQQAFLRSDNVITNAQSEVFIPIAEAETFVDPGFIVFADSTGHTPQTAQDTRRTSILGDRPVGERTFLDGLEMDLNILAPQGSTVHLVIDPLLGDVINAVGSGRIQLQRQEGEFVTFGTLNVVSGDYLFTAGEVFVRRFLIESGSITWDGDPLDARLDIFAAYQTRASRTGLPTEIAGRLQSLIPLIVQLHITGRVSSPLVDLGLAIDQTRREAISDTQFLEAYLNQPDRAAQLATSVLLTNSFVLAAQGTEGNLFAGSAFTSVSQLVSSQVNRYLSQVLPNADLQLGVLNNETTQDLDVTAGLALRLLNERLVIRGQGIYRGLGDEEVNSTNRQNLQGEFIVEVRLNASVSVEVFYRREGDVFSESLLTSTTGAGLSYQTQFPTWRRLFQRIFGTGNPPPADTTNAPVARSSE